MEKEYIVSLNRDVDYDQFWDEIENQTNGLTFIPDRRVDIINERPGSIRSCHYSLTDQEAEVLRKDNRVYSVEIPPNQRTDIKITTMKTQNGNFSKPYSYAYNTYINWGLKRVISSTQNYTSISDGIYGETLVTTGGYDYVLDGTGVDIVIHDCGIQINHPEFTDTNGVSRVQQIDWYAESGLPGVQSANHYATTLGHATHVCGIAAGKNFGWARNARIYSLKVEGLGGNEGGGIPITDCFDVVKLWHINKPVDPETGVKRPTIVNMSWGYVSTFSNITGGVYRGTPWTDTVKKPEYGMIGSSNHYVTRVSSIDVNIQEMIDSGIHICIAAGNTRQKIDVPGGVDYNNYYTRSDYPGYYFPYHRGGSPYDDQAIIVGNIDTYLYSSSDIKESSSEAGPGVDIWAPGTNIMSSYISGTKIYAYQTYQFDSTFKQEVLTGTSMASPQVAGVGALILQLYPTATTAQLKNFLINNSKSTIYSTGQDADYPNSLSLLGSNNRMLYNSFGVDKSFSMQGVSKINRSVNMQLKK